LAEYVRTLYEYGNQSPEKIKDDGSRIIGLKLLQIDKQLRRRKMPKIKTNRGAAKRFRKTGTGKIRRNKAFTSHILTKKSTKRKRDLRQSTLVDKSDAKNISCLIPYL
jgi:large subunit ribosomal protein L35